MVTTTMTTDDVAREVAAGRFRSDVAALKDMLERLVPEGAAQDMLMGLTESLERSARIMNELRQPVPGTAMVHVPREAVAVEPEQPWLERMHVATDQVEDSKRRVLHAQVVWRLACDSARTIKGNAVHRHAEGCSACTKALKAGTLKKRNESVVTMWRLACNPSRTMGESRVHRHAGSCKICREALNEHRVRDVQSPVRVAQAS